MIKDMPKGINIEVLDQAVARAQKHLLDLQFSQGFWKGELEADATVTAGYIPLMYFMDTLDSLRQAKAVQYIKSQQRPDGTWSTFAGGPGDLNATIQCYFSLKLSGISASDPLMVKARDFVLAQGGIDHSHTFTKMLLAPLGQYEWERLPSMPPEMMFLPNWFYLNIYEFASWARATIVALAVLLTTRPVRQVPEQLRIDELYIKPRPKGLTLNKQVPLLSLGRFFLFLDESFKVWDKMPWQPGRKMALKRAEEWIVAHQEADGSWGGIMLPWVYSLIALKSLGYGLDHPVIVKGLKGMEGFIKEDAAEMRLEPAVSPIWDTGLAITSLLDSGLAPDDPALVKAARFLIEKQIRVGGDWQVKNSKAEPGAWAFEFDNNSYPDVDDTAVVALALSRVKLEDAEAKEQAIRKAVAWNLSMQSNNGGWAAFDLNNDKKVLAHIPFADFMTPLDPTSVDVTAHMVELLGSLGYDGDFVPLQRAISFIKKEQEADGSWYGRWGVNYIYGTSAALVALRQVNENMSLPYIQNAARWLASCQNQDGGWGESPYSYQDPQTRGKGPSTVSQTAWALLGLICCGQQYQAVVESGVDYLLKGQRQDGTWDEDGFTGTGFPRAFYLRYHLYRTYFPLMALSRSRQFLLKVST
jgi:squalene-hopene/tetraprenyl-beta-curcumene cyclase